MFKRIILIFLLPVCIILMMQCSSYYVQTNGINNLCYFGANISIVWDEEYHSTAYTEYYTYKEANYTLNIEFPEQIFSYKTGYDENLNAYYMEIYPNTSQSGYYMAKIIHQDGSLDEQVEVHINRLAFAYFSGLINENYDVLVENDIGEIEILNGDEEYLTSFYNKYHNLSVSKEDGIIIYQKNRDGIIKNLYSYIEVPNIGFCSINLSDFVIAVN